MRKKTAQETPSRLSIECRRSLRHYHHQQRHYQHHRYQLHHHYYHLDIENSSARLTILVETKLEFKLRIHNNTYQEIEILNRFYFFWSRSLEY